MLIIRRLKYLMALIMLVSSCTWVNANSPINALSTQTALIVPSNTHLVTVTNMPIPSPTSTPTLLSTLTSEQVHSLIKKLLWNNPECTLPCFMGIIPGQTTLEEVSTLHEQTDPFYYCELDAGKTGYCNTAYRFETGLSFYFEISIKSGVVESMQIPVTLPKDQSLSARKEWNAITPASLVGKYGVPSRVEISLGLGETPSYAIDIYFDDMDVIYEYQSSDLSVNDLKICPNQDNFNYIRLWLGKNPVNPPFAGVPLVQSTTLTRESFVELLATDANGACFTVNKEAFP